MNNNTTQDYLSPNIGKPSIKDYQLLQELGEGAFGKVVSGIQKNGGDSVAIKIIEKSKMDLERKKHHIYIEKEILKLLKHPGIIKLKQTFQDKDNLYFVLEKGDHPFSEYIELHNKQINYPIIQFYSAQILSILEYLHSKGVVHRDLKPENLLLSADLNIKLIDFGTSFVYDQQKISKDSYNRIQQCRKDFKQPEHKRKTSFVGTNQYLSPEMIDDIVCGPGSDLWALGCIIFKLFTGKTPFHCKDIDKLYENIRVSEIQFPQNIPLEAQEFISKVMQKKPEERIINYEILKQEPFFKGVDFNNLFTCKPPPLTRQMRKSKTFVATQFPQQIIQDYVIMSESVEKDSGFLIAYFSPRFLVFEISQGQPNIYYINPRKNNKKTTIKLNKLVKVQLLNKEKFVIIDEQNTKYIFKSQNAQEWCHKLVEIFKQYF